jgi:hypothetical protein
MAYTAAQFMIDFPVFATANAADVTRLISRAVNYVDVTRFDVFYNEAMGHLVAHFMAIENKDTAVGISGNAGDLTYKSASGASGEARVERDAANVRMQMTDPFMRTTYGQRYCWLRDNFAGLGGMAPPADAC